MKREDAARMAMTAKRGRPSLPDMARHEHVLSLSMSPECHHPCARRVTNVSRPGRRGCPGNNRYGARGTLKCLNCRNRKAKVDNSRNLPRRPVPRHQLTSGISVNSPLKTPIVDGVHNEDCLADQSCEERNIRFENSGKCSA